MNKVGWFDCDFVIKKGRYKKTNIHIGSEENVSANLEVIFLKWLKQIYELTNKDIVSMRIEQYLDDEDKANEH
jgi:hypothetical protein